MSSDSDTFDWIFFGAGMLIRERDEAQAKATVLQFALDAECQANEAHVHNERRLLTDRAVLQFSRDEAKAEVAMMKHVLELLKDEVAFWKEKHDTAQAARSEEQLSLDEAQAEVARLTELLSRA